MFKTYDPCYCEQSQKYERFLELALKFLKNKTSQQQLKAKLTYKNNTVSGEELIDEIEGALKEYKKSQKEYAQL